MGRGCARCCGQNNQRSEKQKYQPERRIWNAVGNPGQAAEPVYGREQQPSAESDRFCDGHREPRPHKSKQQGEKAERYDEAGQNHGGDIAERTCKAHAVKVAGQQRHHSPLDHRRKQHDFPQAQPGANRQRQQLARARRELPRQSSREPVGSSAHFDPELRDFGRMRAVARDIAEVPKPVAIRSARAAHPGQRESGDNARSDEGKLEARVHQG